jgi:parvulin-like peptidyl-prolyl isomerase
VVSLRRLSVAVLAAGVLSAGAGCGSASPSAATIQFPKQAVAGGATTDDRASASTASNAEVRYGESVRVDRSEFERELKALEGNKQLQSGGNSLAGAGKKTVDPRLTAQWLNFIIQDVLITHEFEQRKLKVSPPDTAEGQAQLAAQFGSDQAVSGFPKWFVDRIIGRNARGVALRAALSGQDFTEGGQRRYFEAHKAEFSENCVSHILVKTKAEADAALARLQAGEDFAAVAKQVSVDTGSAPKGGDLGCNPKGAFVPEFDQAAGDLPVGQLSDPVQTQYGFHIILVKERKDEGFDGAKEQARAALNAETQSAFREFLAAAVNSVKVSVDKRYGSFEQPATGQAPEVVPPVVPKPNSERTDNVPSSAPTPNGG